MTPLSDGRPASATVPRTSAEVEERLLSLRRQIRLGWVGLGLFIVESLVALKIPSFLSELSPQTRALLGPAPPETLMQVALLIYAFSALLYILVRETKTFQRYRGWTHLGYVGAFYLFFAYADPQTGALLPPFAAGVTIFSLEGYRCLSACQEEIRREEEALDLLKRREQFFGSPGESA